VFSLIVGKMHWIGLDVGRNTRSYHGLDWIGLDRIGLDWVIRPKLQDWVGLHLAKWTHAQLLTPLYTLALNITK